MYKTDFDPDDACVVIIDMQQEFVNPLHRAERVLLLRESLKVIRRCREARIPILVLEYLPGSFGKTVQPISHALRNARRDTKVYEIEKPDTSAFSSEEFRDTLRDLGHRTLVLMGMYSDACVFTTAKDAVRESFTVITSPEVVSPAKIFDLHQGSVMRPYAGPWYRNHCTIAPSIPRLLRTT